VGARALGYRPWGRNSTLFAVILNMFLSRNLDQSMLKMHTSWEKTVKISGAETILGQGGKTDSEKVGNAK